MHLCSLHLIEQVSQKSFKIVLFQFKLFHPESFFIDRKGHYFIIIIIIYMYVRQITL